MNQKQIIQGLIIQIAGAVIAYLVITWLSNRFNNPNHKQQ